MALLPPLVNCRSHGGGSTVNYFSASLYERNLHANPGVAVPESIDRTIAELARGFVSEGRVLSEAELRSLVARKSARSMRRPNMMAALAGITPFGGGPVMLFDSGEHSIIALQLQYPDGPVNAQTYQLVLNASGQNGLALTYGQIIALAGDFYADSNHPISNQVGLAAQKSQVTANFNSLAVGQASKTEAPQLLAVMQQEISASQLAELRGLQPSAPYYVKSSSWDLQYNGITGGSYSTNKIPGRYELIAATNWDHFGADAITSYTAAHAAALDLAVKDGGTAQLDQAYALNAFADHYLTDLFSSGHLRTPRRQLYERQFGPTGPLVYPWNSAATLDSAISGLLARCMHDEDSLNGLWVRNSKGDSWLCYGDARYRDPENYANAALVQQSVRISTDEIYQAFTTKKLPATYAALTLCPLLDRNWNSTENYSPLFLLSGTNVLNRNDESNLLDYTHSSFYLYTAYHQSPDTPIRGTSLFPTGGAKLPGGPPTAMAAMTGPDVPSVPSIDPIGAQGGIGLSPAPFAFTLDAQGRIDVVKYQSGGMGWRSKVNGNWSGWQIIGTPDIVISSGFTSVPTLVSGATNALDVFATGAGGIMLQNSYRSGGWKQPVIGWKSPLPGKYASALTAVVPGSGKFAVFGLGMQNDLNQSSFDGSTWTGPTALGNQQPLLSLPAAVVRAQQTACDLFAPGADGHVWYLAPHGAWAQLMLPGQVAVNSVVAAASWGASRLDWFARNVKGTLSHCWYNQPNWDANGEIWANCQSISAPAAASTGGNCLDVLWIAPNGTVQNRMYTKSGGWVFKTLASGIKAASPPVVAVSGTRIDVMYLGVDGQLYHSSRATTGASWSSWGQVGAFANNGPVGYLYCVTENQSMTFASSVDLAYGVNGQYNYLYRVTGTITFNNATFQDPAVGSAKFGYYRPAVYPPATVAPTGYTLCASENQSYYFSSPTDVAYGANGNYTFMSAVTGNFVFSNQTFGVDPDPGVTKAGYYRTNA
jgi:hypothetical protein